MSEDVAEQVALEDDRVYRELVGVAPLVWLDSYVKAASSRLWLRQFKREASSQGWPAAAQQNVSYTSDVGDAASANEALGLVLAPRRSH